MAKGWTLVEQGIAEQEKKRKQIAERQESQGKPLWSSHIKQSPGALVVVRFLEQGNEGPQAINTYPQHVYKRPEARYDDRFTCLREAGIYDCPGDAAGLKVTYRTVFNMIHRNAPVLRRGQDGKALKDASGQWIIDGHQDQVVYWECSNTTADVLRRADNKYGGLMSRDFELAWTGAQFQPYALAPADVDGGPQPMSEADMALAAQKHDLDKIMAPPTLQEAASIVSKYGANSGGSGQGQVISAVPNQAQANPMMQGVSIPPGSAFAAAAQPPAKQ